MPISSSGFPDSPDSDDSRFQEETGSDVAVEEGRPKLKEPAKYAVLLLNDDYTTMDFVVDVLQRFFRKSRQEAAQIMLRVHQEGQGLAGVYVFEIAETKVAQVQEYARAHGFPLRCALEPLL
ncbi:MAG: ATP-dependent Clp protease adaptor ClpS [Bdellovibrionales bacterium GWB1_55_8]|nr:MAG: ATP-dependent Clp protease adaptor ClpS [Bdellovibrionales bacterium GWB1_55_8]